MKTPERIRQEVIIELGCNLKCTVIYSFVDSRNPTIIISNGYNSTRFDTPVTQSLINILEEIGFNWVHYRFPEREPNPVSESLSISSGFNTLRAIYNWLLRNNHKIIGLFGISFGANISIELALLERIEFLILVNPVIDYVKFREKQVGSTHFSQWRENSKIVLQYEDRQIKSYYRFIEEAQHQCLAERISQLKTSTLVFQAELDEFIDCDESRIMFLKIPNCTFLPVPHAIHSFKEFTSIEFFKMNTLLFLNH